MNLTDIARLEQRLWPAGYRRDTWMVVDSARDPRIFAMLLESRLDYSCLYSGFIPTALETLAPYLVQLEFEERRCQKFLRQAWGNNWGIFLKCDTTFDRLRKHLRGFLSVRDPAGQKLLFRYYDPRVLRTYLPTCSSDDLRTVFGPIQRFLLESENSGAMLEFGFDGSKLLRDERPLDSSSIRPLLAPSANAEPLPRRPGMLSIHPNQFAAFSQAEAGKFEDWMVAHLGRFFPRQCSKLGETGLRQTIQDGMKRAATYQVLSRRDVCKYIDVMIALGRDFDQDKRFPWAARILARQMDSGLKMQRIISEARHSLRKR